MGKREKVMANIAGVYGKDNNLYLSGFFYFCLIADVAQ
jgi:hypothetical protein